MSDNKLKNIRNLDSLIEYLRDELDWPIENESLEDITFDYSPEEIGISEDIAPKIKMIKQIRPFTSSQPWGIFYIEFETKRLPVVVLRRILNTLIPKKRQQNPDQKVWKLHDLLFISTHGEKDNKGVSFAHFHERHNENPKLMTFYWDKNETHFYYIEKLNIENLRWPANIKDAQRWQEQWEGAFITEHRSVIRTSKELAVKMASMARKIRDDIFELYSAERSNGVVHKLYNRFKENLIQDLKPEDFADTYAQTIVYGLFSARIKHKDDYTINNIANIMPKTNPFLRELFIECFSFGSKKKPLIDFADLELDDMVEAFKIADIENIIHDFGRQTGGGREDPVIHFYELFMKEYDPEQKVKRGEFYTPDPVVSFIVRSVDYILKTVFGYDDGLADIGEMEVEVKKTDNKGKEILVKEKFPRVNILDFATGTGTFLKYTILQVKSTFDKKNKFSSNEELKIKWNEYVNKHLLPRLNGFELKMAPYSITHFNLGLVLEHTGYEFNGNSRLNVFLTNTLEKAEIKNSLFDDFISKESHEAGVVKNIPITIIIGNPPYSVKSKNMNIKWIVEDVLKNYIHKFGIEKEEKRTAPLQNDYIKFMSYAKSIIEHNINQKCIIGIITANSFIKDPIFRGLRQSFFDFFSNIFILDLFGDKLEDSNNVFDITTGVCISFFVLNNSTKKCDIYYDKHLFNKSREEKYNFLLENNISYLIKSENKVNPKEKWYMFSDVNFNNYEKYAKNSIPINNIFLENTLGFMTGKDNLILSYDYKNYNDLYKNVEKLKKKAINEMQFREIYRNSKNQILTDSRDWKLNNLLKIDDIRKYIRICSYRPFDFINVLYNENCLASPQFAINKNFLNSLNYGICLSKNSDLDIYSSVMITNKVTEMKYCEYSRGIRVFPLYLYEDNNLHTHNLNMETLKEFVQKTGLKFKDYLDFKNMKGHKENTFAPIDLLDYIYAVLHSLAYREKYKEFLKIDFPRVPYPIDKETFWKLIEQGGNLRELHLLESPEVNKFITKYPVKGSNQVIKVKYENGKVFINEDQYFEKVPEVAWEFYIGGYQPAQKWLKDRKGRNLSEEDIEHYQKVIVALTETDRIMKQIDELTREWV